MLNVEDCLEGLDTLQYVRLKDPQGNDYHIKNTYDVRFIADVATHTRSGKSISTSQSKVLVKLIQRYRDQLIQLKFDETSVDRLIATPTYRHPPYQSTHLPREVRWAGNDILVFRCKYNDAVVQDIKRLKGTNLFSHHNYPVFHRDEKLWLVKVNSLNWEKAMDVIKRHHFAFDDHVASYFLEVANSENLPSQVASTDTEITLTVRNDDFLSAWVNAIEKLEA